MTLWTPVMVTCAVGSRGFALSRLFVLLLSSVDMDAIVVHHTQDVGIQVRCIMS